MKKVERLFFKLLPFWTFLIFSHFGANVHYSLISPLGEKLFPLWLIGILMGGVSFINIFLDVPIGALLDRFGYLRFLKISTVFFLAGTLLFLFGLNKTIFISSLILTTIGWLLSSPATSAYALSKSSKTGTGRFL